MLKPATTPDRDPVPPAPHIEEASILSGEAHGKEKDEQQLFQSGIISHSRPGGTVASA